MAQDPALMDIELGFVRKRDGKIVNVKLFEIFKKFKTTDFVNNEIVLDGETCIANSFRNPYYEVKLNVVKKSVNGGNGKYVVKGISYDSDQSFTVEKGTVMNITIIPYPTSRIESVKDELGINYLINNGVVTIGMNDNHTLTIVFNVIQ